MVVNVFNDEECDVKLVDYGGYSKIPIMSLRQIRCDFMTLPFQASECYLANIKPVDGKLSKKCPIFSLTQKIILGYLEVNGWSNEANAYFEEIAQGSMLQANIISYANDGVQFIHLHKVQGSSVS